MTGPPAGPNEFYLNYVQQQLDRRFGDMKDEMNRRFNDIDEDMRDLKIKVTKIEGVPKDNFRVYIAPVLISIVTAILIAFLLKQGVVAE